MEEKDTSDNNITISNEKKEDQQAESSVNIKVNEPENINGNLNQKVKDKKQKTNPEDLMSLINSLKDFDIYLKSNKNINNILTEENLSFLKELSLKENVKVNLLLSKIYINIITNESLYNQYLISIPENDTYKINILFQLIENCISLVEKLNTFVFSQELYEFKNKILDLVKCIYFNCKSKIKEEQKITKINELMENLPSKFFSSAFLEINKEKETYEILKSQETDNIYLFEEKFAEINNYYEQLESFKKFVENNSSVSNCSSVSDESIGQKNEVNELKADVDKVEFYEQYGSLILKFCKYHNYMFLDKEEKEEEEKNDSKEIDDNEEGEKDDEDDENTRVIFLIDKTNKEKNDEDENEEKDKNKKIENIVKDKQFTSSLDSKEYKELIKKEINNYLKITKNIENEKRIKNIREHLNYYLGTLDIDSYYPLYTKDFTKVTISDNFTPSFLTNVPAGSMNKLYFETPENEDTLVYIEWYLEDRTKDINFEINKYEVGNNEFIPAFKEEKVENKLKFFIVCHGYALYEMVFDNSYSWFNSKDVNYRISLLKLTDKIKTDVKEKNEEQNDKTNENENESDYEYNIGGKKYCFKEMKKIDGYINISVIFYLNKLTFVSFKNEDELVFKEHIEEEETIIPKHLFNYLLACHLKKIKIDNKKIIVSIFSQNKNLLSICEDLNEEIKKVNDEKQKKFIKSIGFIPDGKIDDSSFEYNLYELNEQILINHIFKNNNNNKNNNNISIKSVLLIEFEKKLNNVVMYNKGQFLTKIKEKDINSNIENADELLNIIKYANDNYENMNLIISRDDNVEEENKNTIKEDIEKIKQYCKDSINPPITIFEYEQKEICNNTIKYINSLYEN